MSTAIRYIIIPVLALCAYLAVFEGKSIGPTPTTEDDAEAVWKDVVRDVPQQAKPNAAAVKTTTVTAPHTGPSSLQLEDDQRDGPDVVVIRRAHKPTSKLAETSSSISTGSDNAWEKMRRLAARMGQDIDGTGSGDKTNPTSNGGGWGVSFFGGSTAQANSDSNEIRPGEDPFSFLKRVRVLDFSMVRSLIPIMGDQTTQKDLLDPVSGAWLGKGKILGNEVSAKFAVNYKYFSNSNFIRIQLALVELLQPNHGFLVRDKWENTINSMFRWSKRYPGAVFMDRLAYLYQLYRVGDSLYANIYSREVTPDYIYVGYAVFKEPEGDVEVDLSASEETK